MVSTNGDLLDSYVRLIQSEQLTGSITDLEAAKLLGVSRTPTREAFRRLVDLGLLHPLGRRFEVVAVSRSYLRMVQEAREFWTALGTSLAAGSRQRSQFDQLAADFDGIARSPGAAEGVELAALWRALIARFRDATHQACANPLLVEQLEVMSLHQDRFGQRPEDAHELVGQFAPLRAEVCRAIARGDSQAAMRLQRELVRAFEAKVAAWFAADGSEQPAAPAFRATGSPLYQKLRDELLLDPRQSGAILVPDEVAQRYGVSRTPVREALDLAEVRGLVVRQRGVGTRVRERTTALFASKLQLFTPVSRWVLRKVQSIGEPLPLAACAERFLALADGKIGPQQFTSELFAAEFEYYRILAEHAGNWLIGNALTKFATLHVFYEAVSLPDQAELFRQAARIRHQQCRALVEGPAGTTALDALEELRNTSLLIAGAWFEKAASSPVYE